ncbi:BMP family ABC transporter substrate-binding protein [Mycoplasmoides fastidiosum]|nr:BMP family ABC transporter substrate-binding protein [Mycoplasmoides fastidiosum]UUD38083.1 BMP family ABC transporter substrate-binding protein [Mycoplasmoides fastidiosum]
MMKPKVLLTGLTMGILSPLILAACGSGAGVNVGATPVATTDVARMQSYVQSQDQVFAAAKAAQTVQDLPITLITASGQVNDNSFNQSLWEAVSKVSQQAGITPGSYQETRTETELAGQYQFALRSNKKIWLLSGFQQASELEKWLKVDSNKKAFVDNKIVVVGVDWVPPANIIPEGQSISLLYKTEESAFMVGYATAGYLAKKYENDDAKRFVTGFGGGTFAGVTSFLSGWLGGVGYWNNANMTTPFLEANKAKPVKFNQDTIILNTGFADNANVRTQITRLVQEKTPQVVLPVAGTLTGTTLEAIKDTEQLVIGVDTNQALAYPQFKEKFFTSIEKRIGLTAYKAMAELLLNKAATSEFLKQDETHRFSPLGSTKPSNVILNKGFSDDFVAYSASTLKDETDRKLANDALAAAQTIFTKRTSGSASATISGVTFAAAYGSLNIPDMQDATKNQTILNAFIKDYVNKPQATTGTVTAGAGVTAGGTTGGAAAGAAAGVAAQK